MISSRSYLDDFRPVDLRVEQAAKQNDRVASLIGAGRNQFGTNDSRRAKELVEHYTYWNYVAVTRISEFFSSQFPMVGVPKLSGSSRELQHLNKDQLKHLRRSYGRILQSIYDDVEPLSESHPFVSLLVQPNSEDSWEEFSYEVSLFWQLTGKVYVWAIPNGFGLPSELWVIPSQWVEEKRARSGQLMWYEVIPDGSHAHKELLPPEEVFKGIQKSPKSKIDGLSAMMAAPQWSDNVESIEVSRGSDFRNGANPDLIISLDENYGKVNEKDITRIKEKFKRRMSGVSHHHDPLVVPPKINVTPWSRTPREMDYQKSTIDARSANLALHGVPPLIAGLSSDYNKATSQTAGEAFAQITIMPKLRRFAGLLQRVAKTYDRRLVVWFDDVTPDDREMLLRELQSDWEMGAVSPDEVRTMRNREAVEQPAYQTGYIGGGRIPLDEELAEINDSGDDEDTSDDETEKDVEEIESDESGDDKADVDEE